MCDRPKFIAETRPPKEATCSPFELILGPDEPMHGRAVSGPNKGMICCRGVQPKRGNKLGRAHWQPAIRWTLGGDKSEPSSPRETVARRGNWLRAHTFQRRPARSSFGSEGIENPPLERRSARDAGETDVPDRSKFRTMGKSH